MKLAVGGKSQFLFPNKREIIIINIIILIRAGNYFYNNT